MPDNAETLPTLILLCTHHYEHLRQEVVSDPEGARYSDSVTRDVYFCDKCLEYRYVEVKRKRSCCRYIWRVQKRY